MSSATPTSRLTRILALIVGLALCVTVVSLLPSVYEDLDHPIAHAPDEDWDWQLTTWEANRRQMLDGVFPTWAPWVSGGVPLLGNPESPTLFPGFVLVLLMGTVPAMKLLLLLQWWVLIWGSWWAGREIGLSPLAAHLGSAALLFSVFLPEFVGWGHQMFLGLCWLPLAWVAQRRGRWALAGAALALPMLYGAHYIFFFGVAWLALDALLRSLDQDRLRWLTPVLVANALLLQTPEYEQRHAAFWPVAIALFLVLCWQRPTKGPEEPRDALLPLVATGLVAAALVGPKVLAAGELVGVADRVTRRLASVALNAPFDFGLAWDVLRGAAERPGGHEGQNVFHSGLPVVLGFVGLVLAAWKRPRWGLLGLSFWCMGWGDATPVNLLEALHRLPGFDLLGKVERYALLWTLFLGWGMGFLFDTLKERFGPAIWGAAAIAIGVWVFAAFPHVHMHILGHDEPVTTAPREFAQTRGGDVAGFACVQANVGRVDTHIAAPPDSDPEGLTVEGDPDYVGEAWLAGDRTPVGVEVRGSLATVDVERAGRVVLNQRWSAGWTVDGDRTEAHQGLISAELEPGRHTFRHWPRGLGPTLVLSVLAWLGVLVAIGRAQHEYWKAAQGGPRPAATP